LASNARQAGSARWAASIALHAFLLGRLGVGMLLRQRTRQVAERFLVLLVGDGGEVARKLQGQPQPGRDFRDRRCARQAFEEPRHMHPERLGNVVEPASSDAVQPTLILMRLLVCDADQDCQLLQRKAEYHSPFQDTLADMLIDQRSRRAGDGLVILVSVAPATRSIGGGL
jgi:hypothetical protein